MTVLEALTLPTTTSTPRTPSSDQTASAATNDSVRLDGGTLTVTLPPVSWTAIALG